MSKITLTHRYTAANARFKAAAIEAGWLSFQNRAVTIRLYLPRLTRLEQSFLMREWLLALGLIGLFVGFASLLLRSLGWLDLPALLRLSSGLLEYGALLFGGLTLLAYFLFPIRVLYLYDGHSSPLLVAGSRRAIEELGQTLWRHLEALRKEGSLHVLD